MNSESLRVIEIMMKSKDNATINMTTINEGTKVLVYQKRFKHTEPNEWV